MHLRVRLIALCAAGALLAAAPALAVNLVPNPSFESISTCPTSYSNLVQAPPWFPPTQQGTSDVHNACAFGPFSPGVPFNPEGFQAAHTGVGYAGLIPWGPGVFNANYREYLEAPLTTPLVASQTYRITFWVSLGDSSQYAVDRLGAYVCAGAVGPLPGYAPLPYTPQVESPAGTPLANQTGWMQITGTFVAAGGEDHILIGSFRDDATTNTFPAGGTVPVCYYYVDDVTLEPFIPGLQACCLPSGGCEDLTPSECQSVGGTPGGPGSSCSASPCGPTATRRATWGAVKSHYR